MELLSRTLLSVTFLLLAQSHLLHAQTCDTASRTSCATLPIVGSNQQECEGNGCCWAQGEPSCFFQTPKYIVKSSVNTTRGRKLVLEADNIGPGGMPASPISPVVADFIMETNGRFHVRIYDPNNERWEIPESLLPRPPLPEKLPKKPYYDYKLPGVGEEFYFSVFRRSSNTSIFNTSSIGLFFSDQYLKIGTNLVEDFNMYGLGEHKAPLSLKKMQTYTLWNYDIYRPIPQYENLYGSHPFYMELQQGSAHGVFLRNSNGMDVELTEDTLTYRVIGGVLDFYFFVGSTAPDDVIQLYQEVIGRPAMPPYWALGFQQCRWGYKNLQEVKEVVANFSANQIPLEVMWTDIDYMDQFKDFTTDPENFPTPDMKEFIEHLHSNGQRYMLIIDPGIKTAVGYKPYDDGVAMDIFIKDRDKKVFIGQVFPGDTVFPDFTNPQTAEYWKKQIASFLEDVPVDGLWVDMNEPSTFCDGACNGSNSSKSSLTHPPYAINSHGKKAPMNSRSLDMDALHSGDVPHYNVHNLYGFTESIATNKALMSIKKGKRPFVLSRSTFPGSGVYAAHWSGDNVAIAEDMYFSIPRMLNFQMYGIPLMGSEICGFGGNTTEELCARWMELGAFYPFSRNHNVKGADPQEPYRWSSVAAISRKYLSIRYSLLPYYYSLFLMANHDPKDYLFYPSTGVVIKPLFFEFPADPTSLTADRQFLVGSALLVTPQLELGDEGKTLDVYLPPGTWYDWDTLEAFISPRAGSTRTVNSPLNYLSLHVRGGYIIPMQEPGLTTTESRRNPYSLLVALQGVSAEGYLYLDDGETFNTTEYTYVQYSCISNTLSAKVQGTKFATKNNLPLLTTIRVTGLLIGPTKVTLDGQPVRFTAYRGTTYRLQVDQLYINMDAEFSLAWA